MRVPTVTVGAAPAQLAAAAAAPATRDGRALPPPHSSILRLLSGQATSQRRHCPLPGTPTGEMAKGVPLLVRRGLVAAFCFPGNRSVPSQHHFVPFIKTSCRAID